MELEALSLTLRLAGCTTAILLLIAIPLAFWISQARASSRAIAQAVISLPLVLPPTVIGFYLLVGLGPLTATGRALTSLLGHPLAFSFAGLLLGSIVYSLPFAVQPLVAGFQSVDATLLEAAAGLGIRPLAAFWSITLPLARPALLTAAVLTFTHTVGEFGVVLMLGGNIPGVTRTLSISLYDRVQDGDYAAAAGISLALLAFSLLALFAIYLRPALSRPSVAKQAASAA